jgi:hypothetical protein
MRIRTALLTALVATSATGALSPALAAPKPVSGSYTATAFPPSPTNVQMGVCNGDIPGSNFDKDFKAPFAGRLTVDMSGFVGDWDMALVQDGANSAESAQDATADPQTPEHIEGYKLKKGEAVTIRSCNFLGGPTANVKFTFKAL